ncbi:MAG: hypothetical protein ACFFBP_14140 [Promethearchaeota archaeon]
MSEFEQNVLKKLDEINQKLDKVLKMGESHQTPAPASPTPTPAPAAPVHQPPASSSTPGITNVSPSALVERQTEMEKAIEKPPLEGRRVCPACGGTTFNTVEDKTQLLSAMGGIKIYAKKNICKGCGKEVP